MPRLLSDRAITASPVPLITAPEARALSIDVGSSAYVRVRHGVHADASLVAALKPWERYALRVHAFALVHPGAVLCLESSAVLHGIPLFGETRDIHVYDPDRAASRRFGDVAVHTSATPRSVVTVEGISATAMLDTVLDLARVLPPAQGLAAVDAAIAPFQGGPLTVQQLRDAASDQVGRRGRRRLQWLMDTADPRAESVGESVSRAVMRWSGFEEPELQVVFTYEGAVDRVDFRFPSVDAVGESDGWGKYDFSDPEAAERHLRTEKRREDRLRRRGHPFARWDLSDALRVQPLRTALIAASVPLPRDPDRGSLATLRHAPRLRARADVSRPAAREKPSGA